MVSMPQKKEELKKTKTFMTHYRKNQTKLTKKDYILPSIDLNARIRNAEIHNIVGGFGEPVINANELKLRDFAMHNNMIIMNSFYTQKYTYIHMVSSQFQNSYRLFYCKQEAIRTIPGSEFTEEVILVQITL